MNIYSYHNKPDALNHFSDVYTKVPALAYEFVKEVFDKPNAKFEPAIAKDAECSYNYALYIVNGRFPLGEAAIAKDAKSSYLYANRVIEGRFPLGEEAIAKDAKHSFWYATDVLKRTFPAGEAAIAKDAKSSYANKYNEIFGTNL